MKKISFIGVFDKIDLILSVAKVLERTNKKILVVDATTNQKSRYVVPAINPTVSYVTEFENIDIAVGFKNFEDIRRYLGVEDNTTMDYDFVLIDTDTYDGILEFEVQNSDLIYYVTSFDAYSLKKGIELLNELDIPLHMTKIFFSKNMLKEEEEYFEYLSLGVKVLWNEDKIYFLLENGDNAALIENQRLAKIKFKNLSNEFKDNVAYMVNNIDDQIDEKSAKLIIKNL